MLGLVVAACLVNWFATTILIEGRLFDAPRWWFIHQAYFVRVRGKWRHCGGKHVVIWPEDTTEEEYDAAQPAVMRGPWGKLAQLVTCQMCLRTWVGFAEAIYIGGPFVGRFAYVANGLLYAAGGHLILEARSRVALVNPENPDAH